MEKSKIDKKIPHRLCIKLSVGYFVSRVLTDFR